MLLEEFTELGVVPTLNAKSYTRWVAPVARFGATGVASPQEVAARSQNSGVLSRWVE